MSDDRFKADMVHLVRQEQFARFLWRVIQSSGILSTATDGSEGRDLAVTAQARKNLGLEILAMAELGQPATHPNGQPILTVLQALREEANQPQENKRDRSDRYDRNNDLDDGGD